MRDPSRLDKTYKELCMLHKKYFPDMREGQFILNIMELGSKYKDPFFWESYDFIKYARNFIEKYVNKEIKNET